jgi:hypothetical protein
MKRPKEFKTLASLIAEMRRVLELPSTGIAFRTLKRSEAYATYDGDGVTIRIGRGRCGRLRAVIHELSHAILDGHLNGLGMGIEEPMILGLEDSIVSRITRNDRQVRWWLDAIYAKLPKEQQKAG